MVSSWLKTSAVLDDLLIIQETYIAQWDNFRLNPILAVATNNDNFFTFLFSIYSRVVK